MIKLILCSVFLFTFFNSNSQESIFLSDDSIRGSITKEREWWNLLHYSLDIEPVIESKTVTGKNCIKFETLKQANVMQLDLQFPMRIDSVIYRQKHMIFSRHHSAYFLKFNDFPSQIDSILVYFSGIPKEAVKPPWDGGLIWKKDTNGNPWISVSCQGLGASVWYPCKDHQSDEPEEGVDVKITCAKNLRAISNGRLEEEIELKDKKCFHWKVKNPINNYNVVFYIGDYVSWDGIFKGEKGDLKYEFWVLKDDLKKAQKQFDQAKKTIEAFEFWFGPYPFYEDGYKIVQSPFLGMEHQSAIAYGNEFKNGYLGRDLSKTGVGLKWDFIIVHESGHEWFGNNITAKDIADMWIHESFTNYSEVLFVNYYYGIQMGDDYLQGLRGNILNDIPIIGEYGQNIEGSGDMYYKGSNMIHIIRQIMSDDEKFKEMLREMNKKFYHQTVETKEIEGFINQFSGKDFTKVFDQYLRTVNVPVLTYKFDGDLVFVKWDNCVDGFDMPLKLQNGKWIFPTQLWSEKGIKLKDFKVDKNFYVEVKKIE